ncbi:MAG: Mrp/NBP35 family ATP-binding protein [Parachlamydiaceae bacterium]|nr:Mrp/NBP35 family ATP-binding protein [Parachlamydiaceae bacterium]
MPLPIFKSEANKNTPHPILKKTVDTLANIKFIIGVAAGKGGVGKSTVTVNLGLALKAEGFKVGIMDTDIYGPSIRKMLPEDQSPQQKGDLIIPALSQGIKMISMAYFRKEGEASAVRAPIANSLISHFIKNVLWGDLDFLLLDFPPGTGDIQITLSQQARLIGAVMVTTPQEVALCDVKKAMSLFNQVKIPIIGIVENMSYYLPDEKSDPVYLFGKEGGEKLAVQSNVPFLGQIPLDPYICQCGDLGLSIFNENSQLKTTSACAFQNLAKELVTHVTQLESEQKRGIGSFELIWKEMAEVKHE